MSNSTYLEDDDRYYPKPKSEEEERRDALNDEELTEKMITAVMEDFNFNTVHEVMAQLKWTWNIEGLGNKVPSVYRLIRTADKLLHDVMRNHGDKDFYTTGTGGLMASLDNGVLGLQFILSETTADYHDYI